MQHKRTWKCNKKERENATWKNIKMQHKKNQNGTKNNIKMQHKRTWKCNLKEHENGT